MGIWDRGVRFECVTEREVRAFLQFIRLDKQARELACPASYPTPPTGNAFAESADLGVHVTLLRSA